VNVYVDSSVLLRVILEEPGALREWRKITRPIASELIRVECLRTIDRARVRYRLSDDAISAQRAAVLDQLEGFDLIPITPSVLDRAADPFATTLGSLDAIHLASALLVSAQVRELKIATHDRELGKAGKAYGFEVFGLPARPERKRGR